MKLVRGFRLLFRMLLQYTLLGAALLLLVLGGGGTPSIAAMNCVTASALVGTIMAARRPGGPRELERTCLALSPLGLLGFIGTEILQLPPSSAGLVVALWALPSAWGAWRHRSLLWSCYFGWFSFFGFLVASSVVQVMGEDSHPNIPLGVEPLLGVALGSLAVAAKLASHVTRPKAKSSRTEPDLDFGEVRRAR